MFTRRKCVKFDCNHYKRKATNIIVLFQDILKLWIREHKSALLSSHRRHTLQFECNVFCILLVPKELVTSYYNLSVCCLPSC